ncbi:MAG: DNA-deoxyinosine glycosylase [Methylococcales bacterium]
MCDRLEADSQSDLACGFAPLFKFDAQALVLGSMPGRASLHARQYYAHPHNTFWPIIEHLFGYSDPLDYAHRTRLLMRHRIALWDVLKTCSRPGSLDSSINESSIIANDFASFYACAPDIRAVFFNGATAQREFHKRIIPTLAVKYAAIPGFCLPSTSPAMASLTKAQKIERWKLIREIPGAPDVDFSRSGTTEKNLAEIPIAEVFPAI